MKKKKLPAVGTRLLSTILRKLETSDELHIGIHKFLHAKYNILCPSNKLKISYLEKEHSMKVEYEDKGIKKVGFFTSPHTFMRAVNWDTLTEEQKKNLMFIRPWEPQA